MSTIFPPTSESQQVLQTSYSVWYSLVYTQVIFNTTEYSTVLYCTVLYYIVLYCIVLYTQKNPTAVRLRCVLRCDSEIEHSAVAAETSTAVGVKAMVVLVVQQQCYSGDTDSAGPADAVTVLRQRWAHQCDSAVSCHYFDSDVYIALSCHRCHSAVSATAATALSVITTAGLVCTEMLERVVIVIVVAALSVHAHH